MLLWIMSSIISSLSGRLKISHFLNALIREILFNTDLRFFKDLAQFQKHTFSLNNKS